jgi:transposase-like protein
MTEKLTEKARKEYVRTGGYSCPFCGSSQIEGVGSFDFSDNTVYQNVVCYDCKKEWTDEYTLTGVYEMEDEE